LTSDKFAGPSLDEIFCDPVKAAYFDRTARRLVAGVEATQFRWAALRLRKASRELVNEVKKYHFVFAKRDFTRFQAWHGFKPKRLGGEPGMYLLRSAAKSPLYIGRAFDLGKRLSQHAASSAVTGEVAHVSVIAGDELPGAEYRSAFKEELVRRHQPLWNVNLVGLGSTLAD